MQIKQRIKVRDGKGGYLTFTHKEVREMVDTLVQH